MGDKKMKIEKQGRHYCVSKNLSDTPIFLSAIRFFPGVPEQRFRLCHAHSSLLTPHSSLLTPHSSLLTPHSVSPCLPVSLSPCLPLVFKPFPVRNVHGMVRMLLSATIRNQLGNDLGESITLCDRYRGVANVCIGASIANVTITLAVAFKPARVGSIWISTIF
ncbi:hypothetical protein Rcae01_00019 [Novipirellula caenicola]|uniref:Sodium/calcium exchanger membrane region domain-containing protein n=1 Tax=Novipirellula caenicola TaxID=1536901 RepID=A0ABP9VJ39_9BACT